MQTKSLTTKAMSAAIVTAALALGAGFGALTSNNPVANADTPTTSLVTTVVDDDAPCDATLCVGSTSGGSGSTGRLPR